MDIAKHACTKYFIVDDLVTSDTKIVIQGHCERCCYRMTKIFRYMGTYDRDSLKKLDPPPREKVLTGVTPKPARFTPA